MVMGDEKMPRRTFPSLLLHVDKHRSEMGEPLGLLACWNAMHMPLAIGPAGAQEQGLHHRSGKRGEGACLWIGLTQGPEKGLHVFERDMKVRRFPRAHPGSEVAFHQISHAGMADTGEIQLKGFCPQAPWKGCDQPSHIDVILAPFFVRVFGQGGRRRTMGCLTPNGNPKRLDTRTKVLVFNGHIPWAHRSIASFATERFERNAAVLLFLEEVPEFMCGRLFNWYFPAEWVHPFCISSFRFLILLRGLLLVYIPSQGACTQL